MVNPDMTYAGRRCDGIYIGTVVQHLTHGQIKVFIPDIYPLKWQKTPEMLPVCTQMVAQFGGSYNGNGVFSYPNIGATVVCICANGDQNFPVMLGCVLGGENAFGQYELVKNNDEISSTRHLMTSGKSHIEMYENGKISAIVVDPIRTDAKVHYDDSINGPLSIDAVSERPICNKVDAKEISSINCQFVLDNKYANGTISSSTHLYNPINESNTISSLNGEQQNDSFYVMGNDGMTNDGQKNSQNTTYKMSNGTESLIQKLKSNSNITHHYGIDGTDYTDIVSSIVNSSNYSSPTVISTQNLDGNWESNISQMAPLAFQMNSNQKYKSIQSIVDSSSGGNQNSQIKSNAYNSFYASKDMEIMLETLSSSRLTEVDTTLQLNPHTNKHNANAYVKIEAERGFSTYSSYNDNDLKTIGNSTTIVKKTNETSIDAMSNDAKLKMYCHNDVIKTIDGSSQKDDVECWNYMLPTNGKIEIKIVDNVTKNQCSFVLGSDGVMKIKASKQIDIDAPAINITGQTMVEKFKTFTQTAQTMNITGSNGDCKIKNVSLLNHKHQETQSGDVVSPQPTKTATASN